MVHFYRNGLLYTEIETTEIIPEFIIEIMIKRLNTRFLYPEMSIDSFLHKRPTLYRNRKISVIKTVIETSSLYKSAKKSINSVEIALNFDRNTESHRVSTSRNEHRK